MKHILFIFEKDSKDADLPALNPFEWNISSVSESDILSLLPIEFPFDLVIWMTSCLNIDFVSTIQSKLLISNIIISTSSKEVDSRIEILKSGIMDIIDADISEEELILRIESIAKRLPQKVSQKDLIYIGKYAFDYERRTLSINHEARLLTTKESELLKLLEKSRNQPVLKQDALREVWGDDSYHNGRSMDVYIGKLRKYLRSDENIQILNIHGMGYKLSILAQN
jgi:DNA-binding response OmpR family regulator